MRYDEIVVLHEVPHTSPFGVRSPQESIFEGNRPTAQKLPMMAHLMRTRGHVQLLAAKTAIIAPTAVTTMRYKPTTMQTFLAFLPSETIHLSAVALLPLVWPTWGLAYFYP